MPCRAKQTVERNTNPLPKSAYLLQMTLVTAVVTTHLDLIPLYIVRYRITRGTHQYD